MAAPRGELKIYKSPLFQSPGKQDLINVFYKKKSFLRVSTFTQEYTHTFIYIYIYIWHFERFCYFHEKNRR